MIAQAPTPAATILGGSAGELLLCRETRSFTHLLSVGSGASRSTKRLGAAE
jgi:hypothetical protein